MKIWTIKVNEPMPVINKEQRLFRMGMINNELANRNHDVTWFTTTFDHFTKKQLLDKDTILNINENYRLNILWSPKYKKNISLSRIINHKYLAVKLKKKMKKLEKPELIYVAFPTIDLAEQAIKYGKKNNVPVIVDIRDLWPDIFEHNLKGIKKLVVTPYVKFLDNKTKRIMKRAYALNSISESMLDWGLKKANRKIRENDKFFYIGYDKKELEDFLETEDISINKFNISFFATINNQFDYDKIIELAQNLEHKDNDIIINICGDGPQFKKLEEKVKDLNNIKLLGWTDRKVLNYILKYTKLGFAPYKNTFDFQMSVSNKFAEYISYGLPVILTSGGYMKELLEKNECGFSTDNMTEMAQFIIDVKNNQKKYEQMSNNAIKLYNRDFVAEKIYKNLVDYLENINKEAHL